MKRYYLFFAGLALVSVAAIVSNLFLRQGPVHDAQVVNDIQIVQQSVDNYFIAHNQLPSSLAAARVGGDAVKRLSQYQYSVTGANTYELCATFLTQHRSKYAVPQSQYAPLTPNPDEHIKGRQCFAYQVLPITQPGYPYGVK